jgi:hypothetical protein
MWSLLWEKRFKKRTGSVTRLQGVIPHKTDKSKRKEVGFWREEKLQPDRPHPDREVVLRKTNFNFFSHLISINCHIIWLISIKSNIVWWQRGGSMGAAAAEAWWRQLGSGSLGAVAAAAATAAALPPRAAAVATKTPVATAMAGAQTINNQLKAAAASAMELAAMAASINRHIIRLISMKSNIVRRQQRWRHRQHGGSGQRSGSVRAAAAAAWRWQRKLGGGSLAVAAWGRWRLPLLPRCCRTLPQWQ